MNIYTIRTNAYFDTEYFVYHGRLQTFNNLVPPFPDLNLLDWSSQNFLAVALHNSVYLWDATQGDIILLMKLEHEEDYVCSLSWTKEGSYLAIGTSDYKVQVGTLCNTEWGA